MTTSSKKKFSQHEFLQHEFWMDYALRLSEKGRYSTHPNPWVGAVLVHEGKILGQGWHKTPGRPHAEVLALQSDYIPTATILKKSTLYITLEPCAHHGRTPACTELIIKKGIQRVVIGCHDPDSRVRGMGLKQLRDAGIEVIEGVLENKIAHSLRSYLTQRAYDRPYIILKSAISLDGKIANAQGRSQWISSTASRIEAHRLRAESQAILIGSETAVLDNPQLTCRLPLPFLKNHGIKQPLRIVLDRRLRLPLNSPLLAGEPIWIVTSNDHSQEKLQSYYERGVHFFFVETENFLPPLIQALAQAGVLQLMVEGGGRVIDAFMRQGLCDELHLYLGPVMIGHEGRPWMYDAGQLAFPHRHFRPISSEIYGDTTRIIYEKIPT